MIGEQLHLPARHAYEFFSNNCEHVATYIATGEFRGEQVRSWVAVAGLVGLLIWASD